jgi:hypothetical protein
VRQDFSALQVLPVDLHQCPRSPIDDDAGALRNRHNRARSEDTNLAATEHSITYREPGAGGAGSSDAEPGRPLPPALLYRPCDPAELPFDQTGDLEDLLEPIGQDRAVEAMQFAVAMRRKGYNVYALGASGTGKHTIVEDLLRRRPRASRHRPIGATSTTSPTRKNPADCNCRRAVAMGCARR